MSTVTPAGAWRRITALMNQGWSPGALAAASGLPARLFCLTPAELGTRAGAGDLARVGAAYDQLWNARPPQRTEEEKTASALFAEHAQQAGWAPPMAYDDDQIDAPDGGPAPGWQRDGRKTARREDLIEDIEFLRETGGGYSRASVAELAVRLGRSRDAVEQAMVRHARAEGDRGELEAEAG